MVDFKANKHQTSAMRHDNLKRVQLEMTIKAWVGAGLFFAGTLLIIFSVVQAVEGFKLLGWLS